MNYDVHSEARSHAWIEFVNSIRPFWEKCANKDRIIDVLGGDEDLAIAAYFVAGEAAAEWVEKPVPALDMRTPLECSQNPDGLRRLKSVLMTAP